MGFKEAATLILCTTAKKAESGFANQCAQQFRTLMMKRVANSSFMPHMFVFPGGMLDAADLSSDWLNHFPVFKEIPVPVGKSRIPLFKKYADSSMPGELAFRLCALRETFEECGILLSAKAPNHPISMSTIKVFGTDEWKSWRARVKEDAMEFMKLYLELQLLPDVWSLHQWSNWLTPQVRKIRFDTAFFLTCVPDLPVNLMVEEAELSELLVHQPAYFLEKHFEKKLAVPPPQFYELHRLAKYRSLNDLEEFSRNRAIEGNRRFVGHIARSNGVEYFVLPGDCRFPDDEENSPFDLGNIESMENDRDKLNRAVLYDRRLICNVSDHGHVIPTDLRSKKIQSKI